MYMYQIHTFCTLNIFQFVSYTSVKLGEEEEARVFGLKSRKLSVTSILVLAMTLYYPAPQPDMSLLLT